MANKWHMASCMYTSKEPSCRHRPLYFRALMPMPLRKSRVAPPGRRQPGVKGRRWSPRRARALLKCWENLLEVPGLEPLKTGNQRLVGDHAKLESPPGVAQFWGARGPPPQSLGCHGHGPCQVDRQRASRAPMAMVWHRSIGYLPAAPARDSLLPSTVTLPIACT